jgi:hypothetical protein
MLKDGLLYGMCDIQKSKVSPLRCCAHGFETLGSLCFQILRGKWLKLCVKVNQSQSIAINHRMDLFLGDQTDTN